MRALPRNLIALGPHLYTAYRILETTREYSKWRLRDNESTFLNVMIPIAVGAAAYELWLWGPCYNDYQLKKTPGYTARRRTKRQKGMETHCQPRAQYRKHIANAYIRRRTVTAGAFPSYTGRCPLQRSGLCWGRLS